MNEKKNMGNSINIAKMIHKLKDPN